MTYVLFLDDDHNRHAHFRACVQARGYRSDHGMLHVFSAAEAIAALRRHEGEITEAFLDHDLCEDDHCIAPGAPSKVPTGMAVVDHIITMQRPPAVIIVHSFNYDAAAVMCARLAACKTIAVKQIPFTRLLDQLG
jgi:ActR/RegA family two-component response regulator